MDVTKISFLALKESVLSAEERYFLLRMLFLFPDPEVAVGVRGMERTIGLSPGSFRSAMDSLLAKGFLLPPSVDVAGAGRLRPGRPKATFRRSPVAHPEVARALRVKAPHGVGDLVDRLAGSRYQRLIDELIFWQLHSSDTAPSAIASLKPATRLVLAILIGLADAGGVVRDVGLGRIAHLAGMKRDRLEYQLDILTALGFIRARITGLTGRYLFGQVAGAIFLDMGHQAFASPFPQVVVCIEDEATARFTAENFIDGLLVYYELRFKGGRIRAIKNSFLGSLKPFEGEGSEVWLDEVLRRDVTLESVQTALQKCVPDAVELDHDGVLHFRTGVEREEGLLGGESLRLATRLWEQFELYRFFVGSPHVPFGRYFQYKLDEYVGQLLSNHWHDIGPWPGKVILAVWDRIVPELITAANLSELEEWDAPPDLTKAFSSFIYLMVLRRAYWCKSVLCFDLSRETLGVSPNDCDYVLLPPVYKERERLAITVIPRGTATPPARVAGVRRRAEIGTLPFWQLGTPEQLPALTPEQLKLFWWHPTVRPEVARGRASRKSVSRGDRSRPEK